MDDARDIQKEMRVNFMDLAATIDEMVNK